MSGPKQFAGGALLHAGSNGEMRSGVASSPLQPPNFAMGRWHRHDSESARVRGHADCPTSGLSNRAKCSRKRQSAKRGHRSYISLDEVALSPEQKSACSGIAGFVFGEVERCHGHFHVTWECPDCGSRSSGLCDSEPAPVQCQVTGRCFLVAHLDGHK